MKEDSKEKNHTKNRCSTGNASVVVGTRDQGKRKDFKRGGLRGENTWGETP